MRPVKEGFQQFEILKEKYNEEYNLKEKEVSYIRLHLHQQTQVSELYTKMMLLWQVAALQTELKEKENQLQKILFDFHETQKHCRQLEDTSSKIIV